jgi:hypothetical protein
MQLAAAQQLAVALAMVLFINHITENFSHNIEDRILQK